MISRYKSTPLRKNLDEILPESPMQKDFVVQQALGNLRSSGAGRGSSGRGKGY
jgi:hypothetical protein